MAKLAVIIPAAGESRRFGGPVNKVFAELDGRAVFLRTIELFINRDDVIQTILAVSENDVAQVKKRYGANLGFMGVKLITGGKARWETVSKALEQVDASADYIAIHDAVRPCVTQDMINAVVAEAEKSNAAILATPVSATLKKVSGSNVIDDTVDRTDLWMAQTPQVFKRSTFIQAFQKVKPDDSVTDDAQIMEQAGHPVSVVTCDISNLKITTPEDLTLAAAIIKGRPKPKVKAVGPWDDEAKW